MDVMYRVRLAPEKGKMRLVAPFIDHALNPPKKYDYPDVLSAGTRETVTRGSVGSTLPPVNQSSIQLATTPAPGDSNRGNN